MSGLSGNCHHYFQKKWTYLAPTHHAQGSRDSTRRPDAACARSSAPQRATRSSFLGFLLLRIRWHRYKCPRTLRVPVCTCSWCADFQPWVLVAEQQSTYRSSCSMGTSASYTCLPRWSYQHPAVSFFSTGCNHGPQPQNVKVCSSSGPQQDMAYTLCLRCTSHRRVLGCRRHSCCRAPTSTLLGKLTGDQEMRGRRLRSRMFPLRSKVSCA